ncbi:hypothetical protein FF011L_09690 [Roseimaritima multifibrata]|uniref:Lipocalin-like domain-containing protein n=1 Tax=Roseimaritima multifibrata TaxID=1930274 RepID=A0A517MBG3_9BACT|nr:hypothetical protein [Roseimaritima multifibrata]QDS92232.1 hypothetical protein FF011L_09690 [Roseimaritima multifibrata]
MRLLSLLIVVLVLTPVFGQDEEVRSVVESTPQKTDSPQVAPIALWNVAPLSASENQLVGEWKQTILPTNEEGPTCTFSSDRAFRSDSGIAGRWHVRDELLHIQYWTDKQSLLPYADLLRRWHAPADTWKITFSDEGNRVELAPPNKAIEAVFTRLKDKSKRSVADQSQAPR